MTRHLLRRVLQAALPHVAERASTSAPCTLVATMQHVTSIQASVAGSPSLPAWAHAWTQSWAQPQRGMACSAGLGRAPPKVINIEYDPEDVETFIEVADAIEETFPTVVVQGNEGKEGRPGSFEIETEEGVSLYSRFALQRLPGPQDVLRRISQSMVMPKPDADNKPFCA